MHRDQPPRFHVPNDPVRDLLRVQLCVPPLGPRVVPMRVHARPHEQDEVEQHPEPLRRGHHELRPFYCGLLVPERVDVRVLLRARREVRLAVAVHGRQGAVRRVGSCRVIVMAADAAVALALVAYVGDFVDPLR